MSGLPPSVTESLDLLRDMCAEARRRFPEPYPARLDVESVTTTLRLRDAFIDGVTWMATRRRLRETP